MIFSLLGTGAYGKSLSGEGGLVEASFGVLDSRCIPRYLIYINYKKIYCCHLHILHMYVR